MRILAYTHSFERSGAPIVLFRLLRELARRHTVHVLDFPSRDRSLVRDLEEAGVIVVGAAPTRNYDVGLFNTVLAAPLIARFGRRLPILWWIHEPAFGLELIHDERYGIETKAFGMARAIVFPTEWQATTLYAPYLEGKVPWQVIPYGVEVRDVRHPCPFDREEGKLYLVQLGALCHRKGHDVAAAALERLGDPGIEWICLGNDVLYRELPARAARGGVTLRCAGVRDEAGVAAHLQHCDALLCPTRDDLISLSILEAMSFSRCVVASDFGPIPEAIVDGQTGLLARVGDGAALAAAIARLRREPGLASRLGAAGHAVVRRKHDFARHVARMEAALEAVARR